MHDVVDLLHHMDARGRPGDHQLAALAARQHGVVSHAQLVALGYGRGAISRRLSRGLLHRVHCGVYCVGHRRWTGLTMDMAAVLACGPDAVLSHRSAAALWGLRPCSRRVVEVTVPGRSRKGHPGIDLHLVRRLDDADRATVDGVPVTSLARTILDLAEVLRPRELTNVLEQAERLRLLDVRALEDLRRRSPGRHGLAALSTLLTERRDPAPVIRSELERRFLDVCHDADLPTPSVNATVAGLEVDVLWRRVRLVVELDGHAFHHTRAAFERDRVRDAALTLAGYRVLRVIHRRLTSEPGAVIDALRRLLSAGSA